MLILMISNSITQPTPGAPLTTEEFARHFKYHPESVRRMIREGRLKALPFGRSYRIPAAVVAAIEIEGLK